jgi:Prophage CP4-57 regulatory protein (AlpA)
MNEDPFLGPKDLPELGVPFCINHLRNLWNAGQFPRPVKLSPRKLAWRRSAILAWLEEREAA